MGRHGGKGVAKAVLVGSVVPYLLKTEDHPEGVDASVFEGIKDGIERITDESIESWRPALEKEAAFA